MQLLADGTDPTTLSYWLTWRVLLCFIWILWSMLVGSYVIWKYEPFDCLESDGRQRTSNEISYYTRSWNPCLKPIHPILFMSFRIISFCLLLVALSFDVAVHGFELFYYYTQWTFSLCVIYFGYPKINNHSKCHVPDDMEKGLYTPISNEAVDSEVKLSERLNHPRKFHHVLQTSEFWGYLFQVLFQITAGAVTLTDVVYWCVIVPFLSIRDYEMSLLTVLAHSLGAVLLLGDTALNSLRFPWFRISYFLLWTCIYVIFQWMLHAFVSIWWPYPYLDLSKSQAPLWYLVVALMHIPCYGIFLLIVKMKHFMMPKLFPTCYQCSP
ncbi:uncharacterized protein [Henckelia pumila]|uniref:uncharacterized protein isoform X2 n=1 Tax=Henckelia pumila TaxID=405737 RepID=UPI003C6E1A88